MTSPRTQAYLRAYDLWEGLQGEEHEAAAAALPPLLLQAVEQGWSDVAFVAEAALVAYALVRPTGLEVDVSVLVDRAAGAPALEGIALALGAVQAGARGDVEGVLQGAGRALALLDDDALPPMDRCTGLVVCAAAYNGLSLWELVDELYDAAHALLPSCPGPGQEPAVAVNRVLLRTEWATSLLETGDEDAAAVQLRRALQAARESTTVALPSLWRRNVDACVTAVHLLLDEPDDALLRHAAQQRTDLAADGDLETVPLLDAARALALLRDGRPAEAREAAALLVTAPTSATTGASSFLASVRARVLDADGWAGPSGDYARLAAAQRWQARHAVLVAARSFVALDRLEADRQRLTAALTADVLTGLGNRRAFEQWLHAVPARGARAAVLLLDLDGFKQVNDSHGHGVGDEVLRQVGLLVRSHVRTGDLAVRHGGDEFAVVLAQDDEQAALARAALLRQRVLEHDWSAVVPGLVVRVSVGIAAGRLDDGADVLYRRADAALYQAKTRISGVALAG